MVIFSCLQWNLQIANPNFLFICECEWRSQVQSQRNLEPTLILYEFSKVMAKEPCSRSVRIIAIIELGLSTLGTQQFFKLNHLMNCRATIISFDYSKWVTLCLYCIQIGHLHSLVYKAFVYFYFLGKHCQSYLWRHNNNS